MIQDTLFKINVMLFRKINVCTCVFYYTNLLFVFKEIKNTVEQLLNWRFK